MIDTNDRCDSSDHDDIKRLIEEVPTDTDKLELPRRLDPALRKIAELNPAEVLAYVKHIKSKFNLTDKEANAYEKTIAQYEDSPMVVENVSRVMTDDEKKESLEFLMRSDLMDQTIKDITSLGVVGEDENKGLLYLSYTSRKSSNPISLELRAPSGVGKSYTAQKVLELMPEEDVIYKTRITEKYLDYLQEDSLVGKIFMIVESSGAQAAEYSIRMMTDDTASGIMVGSIRKNPTTGNFETFEKNIRGPMVYVQTSTRLEANPENESRMFHLYLDDSEEHRREVQNAVKLSCLPNQSLSDEELNAIIRRHKNAQRLLEPLPVAISYASLIEFPTDKYRSTRDLKRFLSLIKTSAFYHQHQRERYTVNDKTYFSANVSDYEIAYNLAKKVLIHTQSDINPSSKELLKAAVEIKHEKERPSQSSGTIKDTSFTRKELEKKLGWEPYRVDRAMDPLEKSGYFNFDTRNKPFRYSLVGEGSLGECDLSGVLTPDEMKTKIVENKASIDNIGAIINFESSTA
jgi:DNA primase